MDIRPKTGAGGLRGVKTKGSLQRTGPRQQQKLRSTLERWLIKPSKSPVLAEECQSQDDLEMINDSGVQATSVQSLDDKSEEKSLSSDMDEETQLLTPQDFLQDGSVSPASKDFADGKLTQTHSHIEDRLEEQEVESCSTSIEGSVKQRAKITDFFSGTSSQIPHVRKGRPDKSPEDQDADKETASADVTWLGTPISELKRMPECGTKSPVLKDVPGLHTVMIRVCGVIFLISQIGPSVK